MCLVTEAWGLVSFRKCAETPWQNATCEAKGLFQLQFQEFATKEGRQGPEGKNRKRSRRETPLNGLILIAH